MTTKYLKNTLVKDIHYLNINSKSISKKLHWEITKSEKNISIDEKFEIIRNSMNNMAISK